MGTTESVRELVEAGLGDATPDPSFDRLASLVRRELDVTGAAVSILLPDHQVLPGADGLPEPAQTARRIPLDRSMCHVVVETDTPYVVADLRTAVPADDAEVLAGYGIVAFAGFPVRDMRDRAVGALCAYSSVPREWSETDLAVLADVAAACSAEVRLRAERERARRIQHVAVRANRHSRALLMLSEAFSDAQSVADVEETLARVASAGLGARWTRLALADHDGRSLTRVSNRFVPPDEAGAGTVTPLDSDTPCAAVCRTRIRRFFASPAEVMAEFPDEAVDLATGARVLIPLVTRRRLAGVITLVWDGPHAPDHHEEEITEALGRYTSQALERVRIVEDRREVAKTLQSAMLTDLPAVRGLELASTYAPAKQFDQVGGDWYDAVVLDENTVVLMIGDVTGHDMHAAALMGQLRSMLRTFAWSQDESPAILLGLLDRANAGLGLGATGTAIVARLERRPGQEGYELTWSSAGHLPPLVRRGEDAAELLSGQSDMMLGIRPESRRVDHTAHLDPGDTLLLYTDGLVEQRTATTGMDFGSVLDALHAYGDGPTGGLPSSLVRQVLSHQQDDVAVLAVRVRHGIASPSATDARPLRAERDLPDRLDSAGRARRWVDDLLDSCEVPHSRRRDVMLLTSEVVTNALQHGSPPVHLRIRIDDHMIRLEVEDSSTDNPVIREPGLYDAGGRGMQLVDRFATSWGVDLHENGKQVWFEIPREAERRGRLSSNAQVGTRR
ncbi:SpoIIE family protein phosphatase [Paraoerskovia marina]|uniref:SpoIIE family protein phosphatase n=1 Tax=Paraoerskovia marina TaxID=545619 RepID=UPI000694D959|nr:SpoIIE family protein phosphatase [Paraoerskovia marina]